MVLRMGVSAEQLATRLLAEQIEVPSEKIRRGELTEHDFRRLVQASQRLERTPIFIDDNPHLTIMEVRGKARRLKSRIGELGLIVIDYLQLMEGRSRQGDNSVQEIARLTQYAHRFNSRIFVTLNTILRDEELEPARKLAWQLYKNS